MFRFHSDGDRNGLHGNEDLTASGSYNNINRIGLGGYGLGGYGGGIGLGQQIRVSEISQVIRCPQGRSWLDRHVVPRFLTLDWALLDMEVSQATVLVATARACK